MTAGREQDARETLRERLVEALHQAAARTGDRHEAERAADVLLNGPLTALARLCADAAEQGSSGRNGWLTVSSVLAALDGVTPDAPTDEGRWLTVASEDDLYELLAALNVSGINPEVVGLTPGPILATLTEPDADHVEYIRTDESGKVHCCNDYEHRPVDCVEANWTPRYPVRVFLTDEPDADRAREDEINVWWAAPAPAARPVPDEGLRREGDALALLIARAWYADPLDPEETDPDDLRAATATGHLVLADLAAHGYVVVAPAPSPEDGAHRDTLRRLLDALADCVVKATEYGEQDDGFVATYILPTGPLHRAIPLLQEHGITVRPGFDGRAAAAADEPHMVRHRRLVAEAAADPVPGSEPT